MGHRLEEYTPDLVKKKNVRTLVAMVFWGTVVFIGMGALITLAVLATASIAGKWVASFAAVALVGWVCWAFTRELPRWRNRQIEHNRYEAARWRDHYPRRGEEM
ncbi:MAG: hypothetical protein F4Z16_06495 [Rhodothermaceae bacterium]|nr:hypothetical protein [Rhodothermaceae bacterium]MYD66866.1 hypothetical protein [Rhodothermaceae bacterium]MYI78139.1 hypothetical protein [Gammaproteobacteria bacterium]